jgi:hypothetical protein
MLRHNPLRDPERGQNPMRCEVGGTMLIENTRVMMTSCEAHAATSRAMRTVDAVALQPMVQR